MEINIAPVIMQLNQLLQNLIAVSLIADAQIQHHLLEIYGAAQSVDARDRAYHDNIPALRQGSRGRQPELVDLVIDRRVLLDIGIRLRHIGLGLIVVIVRNEILHRILRKELLELTVQLRRKGFVVSVHQGRLLKLLNDICHGKGLAGACYAQQSLRLVTAAKALRQGFDRLRLVSGRLIFRMKSEFHTADPAAIPASAAAPRGSWSK